MPIPKKIHYCWFGGNPMPTLAEKCIRSWKRYCPGYEIIRWDESNYDISAAPKYVRDAYAAKKWAFVTDYVRLQVLFDHGGIYFDTDVQVVKKLDPLLQHRCFMGIERARECTKVNTGLGLGAEAGFPLLKEIMEDYREASFYRSDGSIDITTCTVRNTEILKKHGYVEEDRYQEVAEAAVYPAEFFSPMDMTNGKMHKTRNTYTIHHYSLSWTSPEHQLERKRNLRKARRLDFVYNVKVTPNRILKRLMGAQRYERFKNSVKGR